MKTIAIMQPTYLPWVGYFNLIDQSDVFVLLDSVQFKRRSWQQRNYIKTPDGLQFLTVPVLKTGRYDQLVKDVQILTSGRFPSKHLRTIEHHYRHAPYFENYYPQFKTILEKTGLTLSQLNQQIILWMTEMFGFNTEFRTSSSLQAQGKRSELLVSICLEFGITNYLSPIGSAEYLFSESGLFEQRGLTVLFQNYQHPQYKQQSEPFLPFASALDLLFNEGEQAAAIIRSGHRPHLSIHEVRERLTTARHA